jgi:hypothetical protein
LQGTENAEANLLDALFYRGRLAEPILRRAAQQSLDARMPELVGRLIAELQSR